MIPKKLIFRGINTTKNQILRLSLMYWSLENYIMFK